MDNAPSPRGAKVLIDPRRTQRISMSPQIVPSGVVITAR
jgi:hypothetical protein